MSLARMKSLRWLGLILILVTMAAGAVPAAADTPSWGAVKGLEGSLKVGMVANPGTDSITYTIRARNNSANTYAKLVFSAIIPDGTSVIESWSGFKGANAGAVNGNRIEWFVSKLGPGSRTPSFVFTVSWDGTSKVATRATLRWQGGPAGWINEFGAKVNDQTSDEIVVEGPVDKPAAGPGEIPPAKGVSGLESSLQVGMSWNASGDAITYAMRARNNSDDTYSGLEFSAPIPNGATVLDSWAGAPNHDPGSVNPDTGLITWRLKALAPGGISPIYVFSVTWDGQSEYQTRARLTYAKPNSGYINNAGLLVKDATSDLVTVKPSLVKNVAETSGIPQWAPVTGFEVPLNVGISANPAPDKSAVTFTMRFKNDLTSGYSRLRISAPIPAGTTLIDSWTGAPGHDPAAVDENGNVVWFMKAIGARSISPIMVWTVSWDGQTPLTTRAKVEYANGPTSWIDEFGAKRKDALSAPIIVKP